MVSRIFPQFPIRSFATALHLPARHLNLGLNPPPLFLLRPHMSSEASPNPPKDSSAPTKTALQVKVEVTGRVHSNVYYVDWALENATELGLKGWVMQVGGPVEALFSRDADKVERRKPANTVKLRSFLETLFYMVIASCFNM
ncbi:hypothetical protein LXL04_005140 [Taraxacum kok-saghyz]